MDKKTQTINTYDNSAEALAKKFDERGARILDIEETLSFIKTDNPHVFEIGCGNGRDALEILKRTNNYLGIDISKNLIQLAKQKVPGADFMVADITEFEIPKNTDVVFAFASLIHVRREEFKTILDSIFNALNDGGLVRISLKHNPVYKELTEESEFGVRTYYLYSEQDISELSHNYKIIKSWIEEKGRGLWLEILLRKPS
jgi:trans-aconitate methyltransferase